VRQEVSGKIQFKREELTKYYEEHKGEFQRNERVLPREFLGTEADDLPVPRLDALRRCLAG
jgi:hypothetical protein